MKPNNNSININFYSGQQWSDNQLLVIQYPVTNDSWLVARQQDIAYERYFVLDENKLDEAKDPWDRVMRPWRKNENDKTTFTWIDTEPVYDLPENLEYQFRWTTVTRKRIKLWRKKP